MKINCSRQLRNNAIKDITQIAVAPATRIGSPAGTTVVVVVGAAVTVIELVVLEATLVDGI